MGEERILGDTRTVYEQILIAVTMAALTVALAVRREPTWIDAEQVADLLEQDAVLLDVRPFSTGVGGRVVPGSVWISHRELPSRLDELPPERPILVFGVAGNDSRPSYELLKSRGFDAYDLGPVSRVPRFGHQHHDHEHDHDRR